MENLGSEVSAEKAPGGAVTGGADVMLVAVEDFGGGKRFWAVGEDSAVLDKGSVGQGVACDEYGGARPDCERDEGAVLGFQSLKDGFYIGEGHAEP